MQETEKKKQVLETEVAGLSAEVAKASGELLEIHDQLRNGKLVAIVDTKIDKKSYNIEFIKGVNDLVIDFDLRGKKITELLRRTLALFTGKPVEEIKKQIPIMEKSQMYVHGAAYSRLKKRQLSDEISNPDRLLQLPFYAMEADGGEVSRLHRVALLMTYAERLSGVPMRLHVAAPITPSAAAEYDSEAITSTCSVRQIA